MPPAEIPAPVRAAFLLLAAVVAVSAVGAALQWYAGLRGPEAFLNPGLEAVLLLGLGTRMRAGSLRARTLLLGVAGLLVAVNLAAAAGLADAFGAAPTHLVMLVTVLTVTKPGLIVAGASMMYRPAAHHWFE